MLCFRGELKLFPPFWKGGDLNIFNIKPYLLTHYGKGIQLEKVPTTPLAKMASCQSLSVFKLCQDVISIGYTIHTCKLYYYFTITYFILFLKDGIFILEPYLTEYKLSLLFIGIVFSMSLIISQNDPNLLELSQMFKSLNYLIHTSIIIQGGPKPKS